MKIHKLLFLALLSCFALSCSQDKLEEQSVDLNERLAEDQFDNSYLGVYKGLFTTNDGLTRGSVLVTFTPSDEAIAQITLSSGETVELKSVKTKSTLESSLDNLRFSSIGLSTVDASFTFSVESNGANSSISNVVFDNKESDIFIAKNLSRVPLTPITGTYDCTNCAAQGVAFPRNRTWNVMSIGAGNNQNFVTQVSFSGRVYTSAAENNTQNGCVPVVNFTACGIAGSSRVLGRDVTWNGTHVYISSDVLACSSVSGSWSAPSFGPGITGTFQSDSDCLNPAPINDICTNASTISCGGSVSGSTVDATNSDTPDFCADNLFGGAAQAGGPGVWYTFSTPVDQVVTFDTSASPASFDTQLRAFSGSCGALTCVGSDDDGGTGLRSLLSFVATANENYYIFLGGWNNDVDSFVLNMTCTDVPPTAVFSLTPACGTTLVDNGEDANYADNSSDTYFIDAGDDNSIISLPFTVFDLEDSWDFMRIYDGPTTSDPEITNVNGRVIADFGDPDIGFTGTGTGANSLQGQTVVSSGRYLTIVFTSDSSGPSAGFFAVVGCDAARAGKSNNSMIKTSETFRPGISTQRTKGSGGKVLEAVEIAKYNTSKGNK